MNELSLHILDICQNSIKANATLIKIIIDENTIDNLYSIVIQDNGIGMSQKTLSQVADPFFTTRSTRNVGMGISLFKMAAEMAEGSFKIESTPNYGTTVTATFKHNHLDRAPLGKIEETISILVLNPAEIDIYYEHNVNNKQYQFDTREIKKILDGIPFTNYDVIMWIKNNIQDGILQILKEES